MICDKLLFNNIVPKNIIIKTGHKSNNLFAEGIGSVSVKVGGKKIQLHDCLFVPDISKQLISLVRLIKKSVTIEKNANRFVIRDGPFQLFSGYVANNLLHVPYSRLCVALSNIAKISPYIWHQRLGHPGDQVMRSMDLLV
jgi:hypothetical protein